MPKINGDVLRNLPIPLPPEHEMKVALRRIDEGMVIYDDIKFQISNDLKATAMLQQSILKRAFEGSLSPSDQIGQPNSAPLARLKSKRIGQFTAERSDCFSTAK
jgi:type I restriction enzyme, S subunit